jgi:hypothetical protein
MVNSRLTLQDCVRQNSYGIYVRHTVLRKSRGGDALGVKVLAGRAPVLGSGPRHAIRTFLIGPLYYPLKP